MSNMRSKPLLAPVVEALERQERVNAYLLEQINMLRRDMGYDLLDINDIGSVVDGDSNPYSLKPKQIFENLTTDKTIEGKKDETKPDVKSSNIAVEESAPNSVVPNKKEMYAEVLVDGVDEGIGLGCDEFDLSEIPNDYVFILNGSEGTFFPNPDRASVLLRASQRGDWEKAVDIINGCIPDPEPGKNYVMKIVATGQTKLVNGFWVITSPATIEITLA